jgi:type I restriction enzyme M protein
MAEVKIYRMAGERITLDEMKQFLWGAATRLRGQIDAAGYKEYIFPLLFFKRISDVYDEQFGGFVSEGGIDYAREQVKELPIRIPEGAHWSDVREVTENVGQRLVEAFIAIEQANPGVEADGRIIGGLEGIFGPKDGWTNKAKMPDHIITSLIEDFSQYTLSLAACPADEMGQAYEYLVGKFADDAGNTAQEFYTNRTVVTLMAEILQPRPNESIYDPTCGSGGMLVKCLDYLRQKGEPWQGVHVFGQEINALTSSIARMNLYLNGVEDFSIVREDTLAHPAFVDGSQLRKFDIVLANPPYSIKTWNREAFMNDKWGRNFLGTPPQKCADYAFFQHILCSLNDTTGRCAILFPHGILGRNIEQEIRANLVKMDIIDSIIGIGDNLFFNSAMPACVVICRTKKETKRRGKILFINAKHLVTRKNTESYLEDSHIHEIVEMYRNYSDVDNIAKVVSLEEVQANECRLNINLYAKGVKDDSDTSWQEYTLSQLVSSHENQSLKLRSEIEKFIDILNSSRVC